jgi:ribosome-binding protein aMBF1 (putative translation factor)
MIVNEREYQVTKAALRRFEEALAHVDDRAPERHPRLQRALRESMESQIEDLRAQVSEYEAIRDGKVRILELYGPEHLATVIICARIAAGLTQKQLAERMGMKEQQVQRYERTRFASASYARLLKFCDALGVQISMRALLPIGDASGPAAEARPNGKLRPHA